MSRVLGQGWHETCTTQRVDGFLNLEKGWEHMKHIMNKAVLFASILGLFSTQSCTQRQVGKGAAVVAVGSAIGDGHS